MSVPEIPGFIERPLGETLADHWTQPPGKFPEELWPLDILGTVSSRPTGWLLISEHYFTPERHGGAGCVLVPPDQVADALKRDTWIGRDLGEVGIWGDGRFEAGISTTERDVNVEFFVQGRQPAGSTFPIIEISYPFLWYWDAFQFEGGWKYLNRAGREQELIRWDVEQDRWRVEVRALEFRHYLAACDRSAILQLDYVTKIESEDFARVDDEFANDWARCSFHVLREGSMLDRPAFSRVMGQYALTGLSNSRVPRFEERRQDRAYPDFIYGLDPETGDPLTHTCDPDELGTYFDKDGARLHYLTPIYFKREVLQPYTSEPSRYSVSSTRLSCLGLWGIDISFNSAGLVEVYLGDLGRDLPSDEWGHWRAYNVPPEGTMDEGRFRRDFLNQPASSDDPVGDLRRARAEAADISEQLLGVPLWRPLTGPIRAEFESLIGPLNEDPASLGPPLLVLAKALVDGIDPAPLKAHLQDHQKGEGSLKLLSRMVESLGGDSGQVAIFQQLYAFRSRGGIAHLAGSGRDQAAAALGIAGLSTLDAFRSVTKRATASLRAIASLMAEPASKE